MTSGNFGVFRIFIHSYGPFGWYIGDLVLRFAWARDFWEISTAAILFTENCHNLYDEWVLMNERMNDIH